MVPNCKRIDLIILWIASSNSKTRFTLLYILTCSGTYRYCLNFVLSFARRHLENLHAHMMKKVIYDYASMLTIQGQMVHKQRDHYFRTWHIGQSIISYMKYLVKTQKANFLKRAYGAYLLDTQVRTVSAANKKCPWHLAYAQLFFYILGT